MRLSRPLLAFALVLFAVPAAAQVDAPPLAGRLVETTIPAPSLAGNLLGDPAEQAVAVYLPPGAGESGARYPVLVLLHGIGGSPNDWLGGGYQGLDVAATVDSLIVAGAIAPIIVAMPNGTSRLVGSFYRNSPVSGGWEDWIAQDLVGWLDATFPTLASRASRGIAGHSMGGLGAIRIGMNHPDLFSAVWGMNPCCLAFLEDFTAANDAWARGLAFDSVEAFDAALEGGDFYPIAILAYAAAVAPRPDAPPLRAAFPYRLEGGAVVPDAPVMAEWLASFPVAEARAHVDALRGLSGLRFDSAFEDEFPHIPGGARMLADTLAELGVPHVLEMYQGDHRNRMRERLTTLVLPWFDALLADDPARREEPGN